MDWNWWRSSGIMDQSFWVLNSESFRSVDSSLFTLLRQFYYHGVELSVVLGWEGRILEQWEELTGPRLTGGNPQPLSGVDYSSLMLLVLEMGMSSSSLTTDCRNTEWRCLCALELFLDLAMLLDSQKAHETGSSLWVLEPGQSKL